MPSRTEGRKFWFEIFYIMYNINCHTPFVWRYDIVVVRGVYAIKKYIYVTGSKYFFKYND